MDNQIIAATIQVDTGNSNANVQELNKSTDSLQSKLDVLTEKNKLAGKTADETGGNFGKLKDQMSALPGPLGKAGEGVDKLGSAFKALLANPVVLVIAAIVAGLAFLYKAFTNTFEGGQKVEQVFAGIKAAAEVVVDRILDLGGAVIKFFSGDFKGALADAKKAVTGVGDEISTTYNKVAGLTKQIQQLNRDQSTDDLEKKKRETRLALLREQLNDESVSVKEKKKIAMELRDDQIANAKDDLERTTKLVNAKIALLKIGKDAEKKNFEEINALQGQLADVQTQNAMEGVRTNKVIRNLDKQDMAERKAAAAEANAAAKAARQNLVDFTDKLRKIQQENTLLSIKDAYSKELVALQNKIAEEKEANKRAFEDRKITKQQELILNKAVDAQGKLQLDELNDKHNKEVAAKEEAFQADLNKITQKTRLDSIGDIRKKELVQLQIGYEDKLNQAIKTYKDDAVKFQAIKNALDKDLKAEQDRLDAKNKKEDDKKKFELAEQALKGKVDDKNSPFALRKAALDAELKLDKDNFDNKVITELEYNNKVKELSAKRIEIDDLETAHKKAQINEISGTLTALADLVGKQTIAGKALGIATALINTYQGASEAIKQKSTLPSPFDVIAKVANVAAIIGVGLATVKSIVAVQVPGDGGSGSVGSAPSISPAAPIAPPQAATQLNQSSINGIGNATSGRIYVLDSDVEKNRVRNERLNRAARLGG